MNVVEKLGEVNNDPSMTVPDMAIPLAVLIDRYVRGIDLEDYRTPYWQEDEVYVPDRKAMDLTDIENKRIEVEEKFSQLENDVKKEKQDRAMKLLEEKLKRESDDKKED